MEEDHCYFLISSHLSVMVSAFVYVLGSKVMVIKSLDKILRIF